MRRVRGLGRMSLGACRALEICTFAKKECIGAREPGSEGESSTKGVRGRKGFMRTREHIAHW